MRRANFTHHSRPPARWSRNLLRLGSILAQYVSARLTVPLLSPLSLSFGVHAHSPTSIVTRSLLRFGRNRRHSGHSQELAAAPEWVAIEEAARVCVSRTPPIEMTILSEQRRCVLI